MKQLYRLLLLSIAGSLFASCSPRAYLGSRAASVAALAAEERPALASASVAVPLADGANHPEGGSTNDAPASVHARPAAQPAPARAAGTARKAWIKPTKTIPINSLSQPMSRRPRHRTTEVAGTPTGIEGLGDALLKLMLLLFVFLALLGVALMLLVKLIVRLFQKRKHPKP